MVAGMFNTVLQDIFPGGLRNRVRSHAGYENLEPVAKLPRTEARKRTCLARQGRWQAHFDKLTDLYHSGTKHEEDQPAHLLIQDTNICNDRCVKEFASPCRISARRTSTRWWTTRPRPMASASA